MLLLIVFAAGGLIFIFAGTLARATTLETEAAAARATVAGLRDRVAAGRAEIDFLDTDVAIEQFARGVGYGEPGEVAFSLPEDAPVAPPVAVLGATERTLLDQTPFEAWMALLFGA